MRVHGLVMGLSCRRLCSVNAQTSTAPTSTCHFIASRYYCSTSKSGPVTSSAKNPTKNITKQSKTVSVSSSGNQTISSKRRLPKNKIPDVIETISLHDRTLLFGRDRVDQTAKKPSCEQTDLLDELFQSSTVNPTSADNIVDLLTDVATRNSQPYIRLLNEFKESKSGWPEVPKQLHEVAGWVKYGVDGQCCQVLFPDEDLIVFDVEVCMKQSMAPVIAVAASPTAWYAWCSPKLFTNEPSNGQLPDSKDFRSYEPSDLVPLGYRPDRARVVVGHNVGYDRARILEQYSIERDKTRFWDTMATHICLHGMTSEQLFDYNVDALGRDEQLRFVGHLNRSKHRFDKDKWLKTWMERTSKNSLAAVHEFHCPNATQISKEARSTFEKGTISDVKADLQNLLHYCASDVRATIEVMQAIWPTFLQKFSHPITHLGMLELSTTYLPVSHNWPRFIESADKITDSNEQRIRQFIVETADKQVEDWYKAGWNKEERSQFGKHDPWMFDVDWDAVSLARPKGMIGPMNAYPRWFVDLYRREMTNADSMSMKTRIVPRLLRMCWQGVPLYFHNTAYWCYPHMPDLLAVRELIQKGKVPSELKVTVKGLNGFNTRRIVYPINEICNVIDSLDEQQFEKVLLEHESKMSGLCNSKKSMDAIPRLILEMSQDARALIAIRMHKLPHPSGARFRVGNPIARSMLHHIEHGKLSSEPNEHALILSTLLRQSTYWYSCRNRVLQQIVVYNSDDRQYGAILPQLTVAGTVTRRSVEKLWMTVSNPKKDRIGSELKSFIEAPPGYVLVGADVDSQVEQWIAALFGDSYVIGRSQAEAAAGTSTIVDRSPGQTDFGRMLLVGSKERGTDMHSVIANQMGIARDQAKVLNYCRLYGAVSGFAMTLLRDYLPQADVSDITKKTTELYKTTKGKQQPCLEVPLDRVAQLERKEGDEKWMSVTSDRYVSINLSVGASRKSEFCNLNGLPKNRFECSALEQEGQFPSYARIKTRWVNGYESDVFNCLEDIALSSDPRTPVLQCPISSAMTLERGTDGYNGFVGKWSRSRVNWVVQSSAVDFLHVLLTCMLCIKQHLDIKNIRFCISVHDEVRYLVEEDDRYKAALALHVSNLCSRAFFSRAVGVNDLPASVAYFSQVDIDRVFRKEPTLDCVTPSNPEGLATTYNIPPGEAVSYQDCVKRIASSKVRLFPLPEVSTLPTVVGCTTSNVQAQNIIAYSNKDGN